MNFVHRAIIFVFTYVKPAQNYYKVCLAEDILNGIFQRMDRQCDTGLCNFDGIMRNQTSRMVHGNYLQALNVMIQSRSWRYPKLDASKWSSNLHLPTTDVFVYLSIITHSSAAEDHHTTLIMRPASDNSPGLAGCAPHCMQYTISFKAACARNSSATLLRPIKCVFVCMCLFKFISFSVVAIHFIFWWHFPASDTGHWYNSGYPGFWPKCQTYGSLYESILKKICFHHICITDKSVTYLNLMFVYSKL